MPELIFLRFGPTSKIIGKIYDPWWFNENGFKVYIHIADVSYFLNNIMQLIKRQLKDHFQYIYQKQ